MKEAETMENQKKLLFLGGTGAMYDALNVRNAWVSIRL